MKLPNTLHYMSVEHFPPRFLKEALIAFSFNIGGLLAGFTVASQLDLFQLSSWAIAVYPVILTARGLTSGLVSGRLGTALHVGTILPKFIRNTKSFYILFHSVIVLTVLTSTLLSLVSMAFGVLFWGLTFMEFADILIVALATMLLGLVNSFFTMGIAFVSFKKALDPDVIVYPVMSTVADIVITLCYVSILNLFFLYGAFGRLTVVVLAVVLVAFSVTLLSRRRNEAEFLRTIKESLLTLLIVAFIVNTTGTIVKGISGIFSNVRELFVVYPALIDTVGDVGSVVGSTATTKLTMGLLGPSFQAIRKHSPRIFTAWTASIVMFVIYSILSLSIQGSFTFSMFLHFSALLLLANLIAVSSIIVISYGVAIQTFRRGLDPDNFVIPLESSLADSITSAALLVVFFLAT